MGEWVALQSPSGDSVYLRVADVKVVTIGRKPNAPDVLILMMPPLSPLAVQDTVDARRKLGLPLVEMSGSGFKPVVVQ